ncbi:MAG: hypothetical protein R2912_12475 [Eubacteriales bacterium]
MIQIISVDGAMAQYASGPKWNEVMSVRYTEEEISRMLNAVSDLDASSVRFTQNREGFHTLVGTKTRTRRRRHHVVRFHIDISQARGAINMVYVK